MTRFMVILTVFLFGFMLFLQTVVAYIATYNYITGAGTDHVIYNASNIGDFPPSWAQGWDASFAEIPDYDNVQDGDNGEYIITPGGKSYPATRFNFTVTQTVSGINSINLSLNGYCGHGGGEDCDCFVADFVTGGGTWEKMWDMSTTDADHSFNITSNIANYIDDDQLVYLCVGKKIDGGGEDIAVDWINVTVDYDLVLPTFSNAAINETTIFENMAINHSVTINQSPDGYKFSWNASGASCDTWANSSFIDVSGSQVVASNVSVIPSACAGKTIGWRFWANNTDGWNASDIETYTVYGYGWLNVSWHEQSQVNDTACTAGSPCEFDQNTLFIANATITCEGGTGHKCGTVSAGIRYNDSTSNPDKLINTTTGAIPFYVTGGDYGEMWDVVEDEGDGSPETSNIIIGDRDTNVYYRNVSIAFLPTTDFYLDTVSIYIAATAGSDYISSMNVRVCKGFNTDCDYSGYSDCIINTTFDPSWQIGAWQNITFDTPLFVEAGYNYSVLFETPNTDNDNAYDYISIDADGSTSTERICMHRTPDTCSASFNYGRLVLYGTPFVNPITLGTLDNDESAQVNFTVNITGSQGDTYKIDVNFTSSYSGVSENSTEDAVVKIKVAAVVDATFSIAMPSDYGSWTAITGTSEGSATSVDWISFNFTDIPQYYVQPYQLGASADTQNGAAEPIFYIDATGNTDIDVQLRFSSSLPSGLTVEGNATCSGTYNSCQGPGVQITTSYVTLVDDLSQTDSFANITLWGNVSDGTSPTSTGFTMYIYGFD